MPVTPHDSNSNRWPRLFVMVTGAVVITPVNPDGSNGSDLTLTAMPAGTIIPIQTSLVKATGTTATVCALV
jgi:hypothetical protein